jgi:glycosyltransferase involved in cell wall biosynthesis
MKVALVASSYLPRPGGLERHVDALARGLARHGTQVEVLTQTLPGQLPPVSERDGFVVRRFVASLGNTRFAVAAGLWEHLRRTAASLDLVHAHSAYAPLALAAARACPRRFVFTPHAPIQRLMRWPFARMTHAVVHHAVQTVCTSSVEGELLCGRFPEAASRIRVIPSGVDLAAIEAAQPFSGLRGVVLTVGRLERYKRVDRVIAAMVSLNRTHRLVVIGDGSARRRLEARAADLHVSSRVDFAGSVPDAELYRWLRTADVVFSLPGQQASGVQLLEAASACVPIVASDIAAHREAAAQVDGAGVTFVSPDGSPFEVADAIVAAARSEAPSASRAHARRPGTSLPTARCGSMSRLSPRASDRSASDRCRRRWRAPRRGSTSPSGRKLLHFSVKPEAPDRASRPAAEQRNVEMTVVALAAVRVRHAAAAPAPHRTSIASGVRIARDAARYARHPGGLERHISAVAAEPARRGARFEVLTQDHVRGLPRGSELGGRPPATRHVVQGARWFRNPAGVPEE